MFKEKYIIIGVIGVLLLLFGEIFPSFNNDWSIFMVNNINESITSQDSGQLLITSFVFIANYLLIFFLIYFGSMMVTNAVCKNIDSIAFSVVFILLTIVSLIIFNQLHEEHFSYHTHLLTISIISLLYLYIPKQKHFYFIFAIILFLVLVSVQWLQLIPALTAFGFGTNDIAASIKIADNHFTDNSLFNTLATVFFAAFLTIAIIFTFLIHLINKQVNTLKKYQIQAVELEETRVALVESKVYEEINMLVHDLKTPLVTVEGLLSLIQLKMDPPNDSTLETHFKRVDHSVEKMNDMISEILYENIKQYITVNELLEYVTSHLNLDEQFIDLKIDMEENVPPIYVNKIRFARAISNILENAITSFAGKAGYIHIHVKYIDSDVLFSIQDNGPGIMTTHLQDIWKDGFSTKESSGIGLSFVKRIVENHQGTITVDSVPESHTQMNISLPLQKEGEQNNERNHINC